MILSERKRQIIEVALDMAKIHGWGYVSMRKISSKIGVSVPIIYKIFGSKELLLSEVAKQSLDELLNKLIFVKNNSISPIRDGCNEIFDYFSLKPYVFDYAFRKASSFETLVYKNNILNIFIDIYKQQSSPSPEREAALTFAQLVGQLMLKKEFATIAFDHFTLDRQIENEKK
jgi:AcrR family transcriptional regulator